MDLLFTKTYACMHACMPKIHVMCMYVYVMCTHTLRLLRYVHVHTYIRTYIHTYTHTHVRHMHGFTCRLGWLILKATVQNDATSTSMRTLTMTPVASKQAHGLATWVCILYVCMYVYMHLFVCSLFHLMMLVSPRTWAFLLWTHSMLVLVSTDALPQPSGLQRYIPFKESFHLAYHAFEILADPAARAKYDMNQTNDPTCKLSAEVSGKRPSRSTGSGKRKKQDSGQPTRQRRTKEKKESGSSRPQPPTASWCAGNATSFLPKVCALLKTLTPELRLPVIRDEFTQQQRLQLEKWMVEQPSQNVSKALGSATPPASKSPASAPSRGMKRVQLAIQDWCSTGCTSSGVRELQQGQGPAARPSSSCQQRQTVTSGIYRSHRMANGNGGRAVWYSARLRIGNVRARTRMTDLPTALEHLVVLTAMRQRMSQVGTENDYASRLQQAAESSAAQHGRSVDELGLRYLLCHKHGFFLGSGNVVAQDDV